MGSPRVSLIFSTLNEDRLGILKSNLEELSTLPNIEIICVDGGSQDRTLKTVVTFNVVLLKHPGSNRAQRYNSGSKIATGDWVVFVHPRTRISRRAIEELLTVSATWGAWTHAFDYAHPLLKFTSWYSNRIRGDLRSIYYLDHCLFVKRELIAKLPEQTVFPPVDIFEDTLACQRLKILGRGTRLTTTVKTSAIRFLQRGIFRQAFVNQLVKLKFLMGSDHAKINLDYEAKLHLNKLPKEDIDRF